MGAVKIDLTKRLHENKLTEEDKIEILKAINLSLKVEEMESVIEAFIFSFENANSAILICAIDRIRTPMIDGKIVKSYMGLLEWYEQIYKKETNKRKQ